MVILLEKDQHDAARKQYFEFYCEAQLNCLLNDELDLAVGITFVKPLAEIGKQVHWHHRHIEWKVKVFCLT